MWFPVPAAAVLQQALLSQIFWEKILWPELQPAGGQVKELRRWVLIKLQQCWNKEQVGIRDDVQENERIFWKNCRSESLRPARARRKVQLRQHWITKQMWIPKRVEADSDLWQKEKCFITMLFTLQFGSGTWQQRRMTENCRQNSSRQQRGMRDRKNWWTGGSQLCRAFEIHSRVLKGLQCHRT